MVVKQGPTTKEKVNLGERLADSEVGGLAGEVASHVIAEIGGTMAAVGFIFATSALEETASKKRWARMVDNPDTFGIPAHSITGMEISLLQSRVREGVIVKCIPWLVLASEDEQGRSQRDCFHLSDPPDLLFTSPLRPDLKLKGFQALYAELAGHIWKIRFRYELFWLIGEQLLHYLPAQTPLKVVADWITAWRSRMPLAESVRALNAIFAAAPGTAVSSPVRRYEDMETQAFYHLQRFKTLPSITTDQAQNWEQAANESLVPLCFGCWAQNAPHAKTCAACGMVLQ